MIVSFKGKTVEEVAAGRAPKGFPPDLVARAERRLRAIDNAVQLNDLRSPPGNRLEALKRDRAGQHSIRINDQWRICFRWTLPVPKMWRLWTTIERALALTL